MKKKILSLFAGLFIALSVAACTDVGATTSAPSDSASSSPASSSSADAWTGKTNEDFEYATTTYVDTDGSVKNLSMQTLYTNMGAPHLDPSEEQHVMVVPFGFTDDNLQSVQTEENRQKIETTFFGTEEEIAAIGGWTSVAEYYNKSSFGKALFKGKVLPTWVVYEGTSTAFYNSNGQNMGVSAAEYCRQWYISEYAKDGHGALGADAEPITYFDQNGDGFIDLIWIVYSHPYVNGDSGGWWAYVTYTGNLGNVRQPTVKTLGFASIGFMQQAYNGYDPHTFIHETGHTYGLDDYYDYTASWAPMAGIDMMDHNIGDHNAFSKFSLGWLAPLVVDDSAMITLYPTTTTGNCFILPSPNYNGTAFDEYFMVELMAPVGLAEKDYKTSYQGTVGFSSPGIRILHVDARVYKESHDTYLVENPQDGKDLRVCNTKGGRSGLRVDGDYFLREDGTMSYYSLVSIMESEVNEENWTVNSNYNATNNSLFTKGNRFYLTGNNNPWAKTFMPSGTNLWNKAKTTTGWANSTTQTQSVDETCTMDYTLKVIDIVADDTYGYKATVQVTKNA